MKKVISRTERQEATLYVGGKKPLPTLVVACPCRKCFNNTFYRFEDGKWLRRDGIGPSLETERLAEEAYSAYVAGLVVGAASREGVVEKVATFMKRCIRWMKKQQQQLSQRKG